MIKKLRITIDSKVYDVEVETLEEKTSYQAPTIPAEQPRNQPVVKAAPTLATKEKLPVPSGSGIICAPLAGIVVGIPKNIGDKVDVNDTVLLLEAMKMQTAIKASVSGTLQEVFVQVGNPVPEGTALVRIE